ncbi:zincin [Schizopora paradoxa]|uniref:Disintegrin and metalloproteinase domain-containing protein B n=1 Tax=Schizopora paradoxa TaxID=27342 RepID=A0A0H2R3B6_9AGAM|nr:zincin [Schizopora paradoxa]
MLLLLRIPNALVLLLLSLASLESVLASSARHRPFKRAAHPSTLALEIVPRQAPPPKPLHARSHAHLAPTSPFKDAPTLFHSDSFRLTIAAFDEVFHLHLRPNDHLVHSAARINYLSIDSNGNTVVDKTEPLYREKVRAYWGEVVSADHTSRRMREDAAGYVPSPRPGVELGWARIVVHTQGDASRGIAPVFEGAFEVQGNVYHVVTRESYLRSKHPLDPLNISPSLGASELDDELVIFRDSDLMTPDEEALAAAASGENLTAGGGNIGRTGCTHDSLAYNTDPLQNPVLRKTVAPSWYDPFAAFKSLDTSRNFTLSKRDDVAGGGSTSNYVDSIGSNAGCPTTQKVVYMGVAADCSYVAAQGSQQQATTQILTNWNTASALYKSTFNVSLGIIHINVMNSTCPSSAPASAPWNSACDSSVTLNDRLSLFSQWRGTQGDDGTGLWHLMSGCPTGTEVGVAWLGTICQQSASGSTGNIVSGTAVSTNGLTEWEVVSHEIGHNFGAIHDCEDGCTLTNQNPICCPMTSSSCDANDQFIMSPVTSSSQKIFSQCTLGNICSLMQASTSGHINATCIVDPDPSKQVLSLNMCGNGIVESGEDCDPGTGVTSSCCDSSTCKFTSGAVCDPASSSCCTDSCQMAPATQVCRPAVDSQCDIAEMCTGNSSSCPSDTFQPNGKSCGSDGLACANGICTSESLQCQNIGGSMNLTTACSRQDNSCQVSCQDPTNSNACVQLQSDLVDGSSCGLGGTCSGGVCQAGSLLDTAKSVPRHGTLRTCRSLSR